MTPRAAPRRGAGFRGGVELARRYTTADLGAFTAEEARRFVGAGGRGPQADIAMAWELLYRLEPDLYDRLARAERIHPAILDWLPHRVGRAVEIAAGTGRLTVDLMARCAQLIVVEPAAPLRAILAARIGRRAGGEVRLVHGFFDSLPVPDGWAELVITCAALTPHPAHGGAMGLAEMERVCAGGGRVVVVWPNRPEWLTAYGYRYVSFPGEMSMEFAGPEEAVELARIFYPHAVGAIRRRGTRRVPYRILGVNPPNDLAYKDIAA